MNESNDFPVVRLTLAYPLIKELQLRNINPDAVLRKYDLTSESICDPTSFVPAGVMYQLVEDVAKAADDRFFGVCVGEKLDLAAWSPFIDAAARSNHLVDFLTRFVMAARHDASSVTYFLDINQEVTRFRQLRVQMPNMLPAQVDAFTAAYTLKLIKMGTGNSWSPSEVAINVSDPGSIPNDYQGVRISKGDKNGVIAQFPSNWLLEDIDRGLLVETMNSKVDNLSSPPSFAETLRTTLNRHLGSQDLNVDKLARLCGMSRQSLQRKLKAAGTTATGEIVALKRERACADLATSRKPVMDIALSLGFDNASSFTRAFKTWTGKSPREYRNSSREQGTD